MIRNIKDFNIKTCPECLSVWIFDDEDINSYYHNFDILYFIKCPRCSMRLQLFKQGKNWT